LNKLTGKNFRLPTEAEWEYAARGGNVSKGYKYSGSNDIDDVGWYDKSAHRHNDIHLVKTKRPNELGIYDMSGNVMERGSDGFDRAYYSVSPAKNPVGPDSGTNKVARGGSRNYYARHCRVAARISRNPADRFPDIGFRIVSLP
jgi:formylglycine-generating enzyme required for sulfatase activity